MTKTNGTKGRKLARTATATKDTAQEATAPATDAQSAPVAPKGAQKRIPKEDLVVFAFRLTPAERDLIHQAAGPAKASRFIRNLAVTASKGDAEAVAAIVQAVKAKS